MTVQLSMLDLMTLPDSSECISLPASEAGIILSTSLDGLDPSGPVPAPASRSARQAAEMVSKTTGISGQRGFGSSESAALQSSLESKFQLLLSMVGSTSLQPTWKRKITPLGRSAPELHV